MREKIQNYLVFTSFSYRIVMFAILPVCLLLLQVGMREQNFLIAQAMITVTFVAAEVFADKWVFGEVAVKGGEQLEYVKSSPDGMKVMKTVLGVNMLRQFLTGALLVILCFWIWWSNTGEVVNGKYIVICLDLILLEHFFITTQLFITRCIAWPAINIEVPMLGGMVMLFAVYNVTKYYYAMLPVLVILSVMVSVFSVKMVMKRLKESYYDGAD